ncbi:MAG: hypothetical protein A3E09_01190 [Candidatus Liptonbacteria bacterium RIFCSPHIGHO2_12_FULL_60_13]|uniref:Uncharacterized protein n=1 Tax=Candidatus Liptonbacteria bacterium RIFCSPHIGHO2_12_FULL_60_13 TaxID=1798648 RepID=A0A1G2CCF8_9BACT|nr:MAG: hypothetical protein A3E09_01190 [Candidatus Liptonbacteria bacterium RIFCSPHIGHO2_12_FULL_60_13]
MRGLAGAGGAGDSRRNKKFADARFTKGNKRRVDGVENKVSPQKQKQAIDGLRDAVDRVLLFCDHACGERVDDPPENDRA